jgi:hypothetical protein
MALQSTLTDPDYTETHKDPKRTPRYNVAGNGTWTLAGYVVTTSTQSRSIWTAATKEACDLYASTYTAPTGAAASINITPQNIIVGSWQLEITVTEDVVTWEAVTA